MSKKQLMGTFLVLLAGALWGTMGLFVKYLSDGYGFSSMQIVFARLLEGAVLYWFVIGIFRRKDVRISKCDFLWASAMGIFSLLMFAFCYFQAITRIGLSVAAVLLYTSPIWIMLMSALFFKEAMTVQKILVLFLAFAGCVFVSGLSGVHISPIGILFGLLSGIGYGAYSIFGTILLRKNSSLTVTAYAFTVATVGAACLCNPMAFIHTVAVHSGNFALWVMLLLMGIVTAFVPYLSYTKGLELVGATRASILATIEPMVATLLGVLVYHEKLSVWAILGIGCILSAIILKSVLSDRKEA